ncbi:MAG: hypothetical protein ACTHU0_00990 [Kofleriaceae bacterium]
MKLEYRDLGLGKVLEAVAKTDVVKVRVGVVGPKAVERTADGRLTNAENAVIQQYGLGPPHYVARDFLNRPFKDEQARVASILRRVAGRIVRLQETPEEAVDWAGGELAKIAKDAIDGPPHIPPKNAPSTVEKKGFDHPLVETNTLRDAVSHRVVREGGGVLEAGSAIGDYEIFEIGGD